MANIIPMTEIEQYDQAKAQAVAVIYKHSTRCNVSDDALVEVKGFLDRHPDIPVYYVDVLENRSVSNHIANDLKIRHKSPQVIVMRNGSPVWDVSHFQITRDDIAAHAAL